MTIIDAGKLYEFQKTPRPPDVRYRWQQLDCVLPYPFGSTTETLFGKYLSYSNATNTFVSTPKSAADTTPNATVYKLQDNKTFLQRELWDLTGYGYSSTGLYGSAISDSANNQWIVTTGFLSPSTYKVIFFRKDPFAWAVDQLITAPVGTEYRECAISGDGNTAFVAAFASEPVPGYHYVNVYVRDGGAWTFQATLTPTNYDGVRENFGKSIVTSTDGNVVVIGAPNDGVDRTSSVYVFTRVGTSWSERVIIDSPEPANTATQFGVSLSMTADGTSFVVGDPQRTAGGGAYVYTGSGASWTLNTTLTIQSHDWDQIEPTGFGQAVAISGDGNIIAIGAPTIISDATIGDNFDAYTQGWVEVFRKVNGTWRLEDVIHHYLSSSYWTPLFGSGIAINTDGSLILIGAPQQTTEAATTRKGAISIFANDNYTRTNPGIDATPILRPVIIVDVNKKYFNPRAEEVVTFTVTVKNEYLDQTLTNLEIYIQEYQMDALTGVVDSADAGTVVSIQQQASFTINTDGAGKVSSVTIVDGGFGYTNGNFTITDATLTGNDNAFVNYVADALGTAKGTIVSISSISGTNTGYTPNQTNVPVSLTDAPKPWQGVKWNIPSIGPGDQVVFTRTGTIIPTVFGKNPTLYVRTVTSDQIPQHWENDPYVFSERTEVPTGDYLGSRAAVLASKTEIWSTKQQAGQSYNRWENGRDSERYQLLQSGYHAVKTGEPTLYFDKWFISNYGATVSPDFRPGFRWFGQGSRPAVSPTGRFIIYHLRDAPWISVYKRNVVGYIKPSWTVPFPNPTDIPANFAHHISISPNGNYMAYCENALGGLKVYKRIANTLQWELLPSQPSNVPDGMAVCASWSENGDYLAVAATGSSRAWYCWKFDTNTETWTDISTITRFNGSNNGGVVRFARNKGGRILLGFATGLPPAPLYASSSDWVSSANDTINFTTHSTGVYVSNQDATGQHFLQTGDIAYIEGPDYNIGFGTTDSYKWVRKINEFTIALYNTQGDAISDTNRINLTASINTGNPNAIYPGATGTFDGPRGGGVMIYELNPLTDTFTEITMPKCLVRGIAQTHADYDGIGGNGTFTGGVNYNANDIIYLYDVNSPQNSVGTTIQVLTVNGSGTVLTFSVSTTPSPMGHQPGTTLPQYQAKLSNNSTPSPGTGFSLTPDVNNWGYGIGVSIGGATDIAWSDDRLFISTSGDNSGSNYLQVYDRSGTYGEILQFTTFTSGSLSRPGWLSLLDVSLDGTMLVSSRYEYWFADASCIANRFNGTTVHSLALTGTEDPATGISTNPTSVVGGNWASVWPTHMSAAYVNDIDY